VWGVGPTCLILKGFLKSKWLAEKICKKYVFFTNCIYAGNLGLIQAWLKAEIFFYFYFNEGWKPSL
jgi:hypothetical protein